MNSDARYRSPLESRYASPQMQAIWSPRRKFTLWRRLWLALAESEQELGLDITDAQIAELRACVDTVDLEAAAAYEHRFRHDVMAHIHALGDQAPAARPIIHLGATSQFVGCNAELILLRDALELTAGRAAAVVLALAGQSIRHRDLATLSFTHFQPAQPTTVGRRAALWAHDIVLALEDIEHRLRTLPFRGVKGTTGTQASFLALFGGDHAKVEALDRRVAERMGWPPERVLLLTSQTYPRLIDAQILASLGVLAATVQKCATDLRLLAHRREVEEPFGREQIGSSAMAYKRNPMRCERICGMCRFVITLGHSAFETAATQWLERTLDDSSNRRLILPEAFLALDGALELMREVATGMVVNEGVVRRGLMDELPFMATENLLMAAVAAGADRQAAHEIIRRHSLAAAEAVKTGGRNDLLDRLRTEPAFAGVDPRQWSEAGLDPVGFVGRAREQVDRFQATIVRAVADRWAHRLPPTGAPTV
ncbi:MAG: adenylosuccinate lyase [Phycisphaeraceae bacterium]|nr:adenylosuccinate lyase [Phycisphaeraceae bacterium]